MKKLLRILLIRIPLGLILLSLLSVVAFKYLPVYVTPLMAKRVIEYKDDNTFHQHKKWVSLKHISPNMAKAVIASEDNKFATHNGFDFEEMQKMYKEHQQKGKKIRGCSTISQQTAKNVFTFCSDTWLRKGVEAYFTFLIEKIWGKERIMEVYLNVIEMGKGIYGAQAAAKQYYGKSAAELNMPEAAMIAACLPNPLKRSPANPSGYLRGRQSTISGLTTKIAYPDWLKYKATAK